MSSIQDRFDDNPFSSSDLTKYEPEPYSDEWKKKYGFDENIKDKQDESDKARTTDR